MLPVKELSNYLVLMCLDKDSLKKAIYKKYLKKKSTIPYKDNMATRIMNLEFCYDGSYFADTIAMGYDCYTTNLRNTQNFFPFRQLIGINHIIFSPDESFIILQKYSRHYILYNISPEKLTNLDNPTNGSVPKIHPNSNAIIMGNKLHTIDSEQNITTTLISENDTIEAIFHPSLPLIISAEKNRDSKTEITVHNVEKSTKQLIGAYKTNPNSTFTDIITNSDGSLLLVGNTILLNIQDPYNPIILKQHTAQASYSKGRFITQNQIIFFLAQTKEFFLFNKDGKVYSRLG